MDERRKERDDKRRELGDNLIEADERTMAVQTALAELPMDERNAACAIELRRQKKLTLADSILALPPAKSLLVRCGTRSLILPPK